MGWKFSTPADLEWWTGQKQSKEDESMTEMEQAIAQAQEDVKLIEGKARLAKATYIRAAQKYIEELEGWRVMHTMVESHRDDAEPLARHYITERGRADEMVENARAEAEKWRDAWDREEHGLSAAKFALRMMEVEDMGENPEKYLEKYRAGSK